MTTTLIVGATGMTGRLLVEQLLDRNQNVRVIVRSRDKFSGEILNNPKLMITEASVLDLSNDELASHVNNCDAVASCLGHVLDFNGMFGKPRKLCTEATQRLCTAIKKNNPSKPTKFILMNTVGVYNPDCNEKRTWYDRGLLTLLHHTIPPHSDNETAAEQLYKNIGRNDTGIEWCSVRPDSLINDQVSAYEINGSPTTGIFTGRPTSRANVAHFMAELIENAELWNKWKFRMPVIMNSIE